MGVQGLMRAQSFCLSALIALVGCTQKESALVIGARTSGEACDQISDCEAGLDCASNVCTPFEQPDVTGREGTACTGASDCRADLCCGNQSVCRARVGAGCGLPDGSACGLSADCDVGLVCDGSGTCVAPGGATGQGGLGDSCSELTDCLRPLICGAGDRCEQPPFLAGVSCTRSDEELGAFRPYFEVPRGQPLDEFYRQPFPSDVRLVDGHIDLAGHPSPGVAAGVDFTGLYLGTVQADLDGFGLTQPVFIRFSDFLDETTLTIDGASPSMRLVNIDPRSPQRGQPVPIQMSYSRDAAQFICGSALAVAPQDGVVLQPSTTYAVIVSSEVRSFRGEAPIQDGDFREMLENATPSTGALADAHAAYAPLREFMTAEGIANESVAVAAVYTTGDPAAVGRAIRAAVLSAPAAVFRGAVVCDGNAVSPCNEPNGRGCTAPSNDFIEIQAKVTNPVIQRGTRPYAAPGANGLEGAIEVGSDGSIVVQGSEEVCVVLAIPRNAPMPQGGWPLMIYGHGTGGSYLSGLGRVAEGLTREGVAVLSYDGAMHGPRQGLPPQLRQDPGRFFFNIANPRAARDNVLQGAADLHNLVRLASTAVLGPPQVGSEVRFDPSKITFWGHSQGTVVGAPFVATELNLRAAVFSGAGAEIGLTLISKKKPNDISSAVRGIFGDQTVSRLHPMIGLMSALFGPSDATPFAHMIALEPPEGRGALDFLHVYGLQDGFSPEVTEAALVRAGGYPIVGPELRALPGVSVIADPASGNLNGATVGSVQYEPPRQGTMLEYDGHFVSTRDPGSFAQLIRFLATASQRNEPTVIQRSP